MAIQLDLTTSHFGIAFNGAYFRVVTAAVSRQRNPEQRHSVMIDVAGYATVPQNEDTKEIEFKRHHVPLADVEAMQGDTFLSKCYVWVMANPEYAGAVAV